MEAFPRVPEAPACSSLALWAGPAPLLTSLLASAGMPSPPSVYFLSGWGPGSWKPCSHPLPTLPSEDQTHQGCSQRGACGLGKAPSSLPGTPAGKENCAVGGCLGGLFQTYHISPSISPVHDQYSPDQYSPAEFSFKILYEASIVDQDCYDPVQGKAGTWGLGTMWATTQP